MLFIHETFLFYKMETFKNCKEIQHIMITIIDYDFWSYVIFDQQLKITLRKSPFRPLPEKVHSPLFTHSPLKHSKSASPPPLFANFENFSGDPAERGEDPVKLIEPFCFHIKHLSIPI